MMGQGRVTARVSGPFGSELVEFVAHTGATLTVLPRGIADRLGLIPLRDDPVRLAGGARVTYPRAEIRLELDGQVITTPCWVAPGGDPLLGLVALESVLLVVDPIQQRLVPTEGLAGGGETA